MTTTVGRVDWSVREAVGYLRLDAPPHNILTGALMDELTGAVERAAADRSLVAIALSASGPTFSAGADVQEHRPELAPAMIASFSRLFGALGAIDLPVVMAVSGAALGAGFELAMMADVLIATPKARFGQPEIRLGFFAPVGVAWLPQRIGLARAVDLLASGRTATASEMAAMGLVSRLVEPDQLDAAVEATLADFRKASPAVMRLNIRLARRLAGRPFEEARREAERVFLDELIGLDDVREGIAAFVEKRTPQWRNR